MYLAHAEILLRVRAEGFARARWPARSFAHTLPAALSSGLTRRLYSHWITFVDEQVPHSVGMFLADAEAADPVYEVVEVCDLHDVRRSLWRYRRTSGWREVLSARHGCGGGASSRETPRDSRTVAGQP